MVRTGEDVLCIYCMRCRCFKYGGWRWVAGFLPFGGFTVIVDRLVNLFTSVECCDATC